MFSEHLQETFFWSLCLLKSEILHWKPTILEEKEQSLGDFSLILEILEHFLLFEHFQKSICNRIFIPLVGFYSYSILFHQTFFQSFGASISKQLLKTFVMVGKIFQGFGINRNSKFCKYYWDWVPQVLFFKML